MKQFIGCDSHRRYSVFVSMDERGKTTAPVRVEHEGEALKEFLATLPRGSDVALEATGSWYWLVDALESAGLKPRLTQAFAVRKMLAKPNKTDGLDAGGLDRRQPNSRPSKHGAFATQHATVPDRY